MEVRVAGQIHFRYLAQKTLLSWGQREKNATERKGNSLMGAEEIAREKTIGDI